jgi:hypothetical protein
MTFVIGTPHTKGAGYFLDNQALNPSQHKEADVQQCPHCETVIFMQKWKDDGGFCGRCMKPICGPCADRMLSGGCVPAIREIEKTFDMTMKLQQFRRLAGLDAPPTDYRPTLLVAVGAQPTGVK